MLFHRCDCPDNKAQDCVHAWHYYFEHDGRSYERSTKQTSQQKAARVEKLALAAAVNDALPTAMKLAPHLKAFIADYLAFARGDHPATADEKDARILLPKPQLDPLAKRDGRKTQPRGPSFLEVVGDKRLDQITAWDIEKWRSVRLATRIRGGRKVSRETVNRDLNIIRGLFSKAVIWRHLKVSPVGKRGEEKAVKSFKTGTTPIRVLTQEERVLVLSLPDERFRTYCQVTLETLMRIGEVLQLKRTDLGPATIQRRLKGGEVAKIPVTRALIATLRAFLKTPQQVYVFGDPAPNPRSVASLMTKAFRKAGLHGIHHHDMRHTGITDMLEDGISPKAIKKYAGWTTLRMLEKYGDVRDAELLRAVQATAARNEAAFAEVDRREAEAKTEADAAVGAQVGAKDAAGR